MNPYFIPSLRVLRDYCIPKPTSGKLNIDANINSENGIDIKSLQSPAGGSYIIFRNSAGDVAGSITHSGTTTVAYNTSSDYRLKENIAPMTGALATVSQLKPVTYKWKADGSDSQGFIAHELQAVVPDCVTGEKEAVDENGNPKYQGVDTSFLVATLTKAIQEQQLLIEQLLKTNEKLLKDNQEILKRLEALEKK